MAKLNATQIKQLMAVGIKGVATEEAAKAKLVEFLAANEVENTEDESLIDLINMADAFIAGETVEEQEEEPEEEADLEELADEVEDDELEPELEDEEPAKPAPKATAKTAPKTAPTPAAKVTAKPAAKPAIATKATPAPTAKKTVTPTNGALFDARNIEDHNTYLDIFKEIFPEDEYKFDILKQGFTVRLRGSNALPTIMNFDELRIVGNALKGNLYLNRLRTVAELESYLTEELLEQTEVPKTSGKGVTYIENYKRGMFRGETHPSIKGVTQDQVFDILGLSKDGDEWSYTEEGALNESLKRATGTDKKMGENREKMEQKLEASKATPVKKK